MERKEIESLIKEHMVNKETGDKTVISGLFYAFKEEVLVALAKIESRVGELANYQKIANGRTGKLEEAVNHLREADILIGEKIKNLRDGNKLISDRMWIVITGVSIAVIVTLINKFLIK